MQKFSYFQKKYQKIDSKLHHYSVAIKIVSGELLSTREIIFYSYIHNSAALETHPLLLVIEFVADVGVLC